MDNDYSEILKQMEAYKETFLKEQKPIVKRQMEMLPAEIQKDLCTLEWKFANDKICYADYISRKTYLQMLKNGTYTLKAWRKRVNDILLK